MADRNLELTFHPLTADRWGDFERLFGPRGACAGCWCMFWKLPQKNFNALVGEGTHKQQQMLVEAGATPGLLAYDQDAAVGWCAVEPRSAYPRLARSHVLKPVDDEPVWSITCFFIDKKYRGQGATVALLKAAIGHVRERGGRILEGYPVEPKKGKLPAAFAYTGLASAFRRAGFTEVARNSDTRPIYRYVIGAE
jgi:GNAT superfamily N-acetyltransferase